MKCKKTIKGEFISVSCFHPDKDIFILIFFLIKKTSKLRTPDGGNGDVMS